MVASIKSKKTAAVLAVMGLELGVEEGLDIGRGELDDELHHRHEYEEFENPERVDEPLLHALIHALGHEVQGEDDGHHDAPGESSLKEYREIGRVEFAEHPANHIAGGVETVGTEENPQCGYKDECYEPCTKVDGQTVAEPLERVHHQFVDAQAQAMPESPNDEGPSCTVPQAAKQHRGHEIEVLAHFALAVATQRNVEVVAQPERE